MIELRQVEALERIAAAFESIAKTAEIVLQKSFPAKPAPRDTVVTHILTEEERLREDQGETGEEDISRWTTLGEREKRFAGKT